MIQGVSVGSGFWLLFELPVAFVSNKLQDNL